MSAEYKLPGMPDDEKAPKPEKGRESSDADAMRFADEVMGIVRSSGDKSEPNTIERAFKATGIHQAVLRTAFNTFQDGETLLWYMEHLSGLGQCVDVDDLCDWTAAGLLPQFIYDEKKRCDAAAGN